MPESGLVDGGLATLKNSSEPTNNSNNNPVVPSVESWADITSDENNWHDPDRQEVECGENSKRQLKQVDVEIEQDEQSKLSHSPSDEVNKEQVASEESKDDAVDSGLNYNVDNRKVKNFQTNGTIQGYSDDGRKAEKRNETNELQVVEGTQGDYIPADLRSEAEDSKTAQDAGSPTEADQEIAAMEAEIQQMKDELNGTAGIDTGSGDYNSEGDGRGRKGSRTGVVKGSLIKSKSSLYSGKLR